MPELGHLSGSVVLGLHYNDIEPPTMEHPNHSLQRQEEKVLKRTHQSFAMGTHMRDSKAQEFWEERTLGEEHSPQDPGEKEGEQTLTVLPPVSGIPGDRLDQRLVPAGPSE